VTGASTHLGFCEFYFMGGTNYSGEANLEIGDHLETKMTYETLSHNLGYQNIFTILEDFFAGA